MKYVDDNLRLYVYRLNHVGHREIIDASVMLDIDDSEVGSFLDPIKMCGYVEKVGHEEFVLRLSLHTKVQSMCVVCLESFSHELNVVDICEYIQSEDVSDGVFDCKELLRQELLLAARQFQECNDGCCPERKWMNTFLNRESRAFEGHNPFNNL